MNVIQGRETNVVDPFAKDICVVDSDILIDTVDMEKAKAAVLMDVKNNEVLYAKSAHEILYPASLTKVMTAIVALKYGKVDQLLTASDVVNITEKGAVLCGLKKGDTMTLDQALHVLLIYSANDAAMLIAENIGGTVDHFIDLMNEEALRLGATNTHFMNPHGLTDEEHYTTAYDLYLIFREALTYDSFSEIIHMSSYQTTYYDRNGAEKKLSYETTNKYFKGIYTAPENVTIMGGKTGTTNAAGSCLILLSKDSKGNSYISCILHSESADMLYTEMTDLLEEIKK